MKDKSMSEELKAKSKSKGQATDGTADQPSILQEATRQMQDEKKAALEEEKIHKIRYQNYIEMYEELKNKRRY